MFLFLQYDKLNFSNLKIDDGSSGILQKTLSFGINQHPVRLYSVEVPKVKENIQANVEDKVVSDNNDDNRTGPTKEQLKHVYNILSNDVSLKYK